MALAVPLSRFTSRVGGGSAFYVRQQAYERFRVKINAMKNIVALILATGTLFIAGCCTPHDAKAWDYKVVSTNQGGPDLEARIQKAAADGWTVVSSGGGDIVTFAILRKPK